MNTTPLPLSSHSPCPPVLSPNHASAASSSRTPFPTHLLPPSLRFFAEGVSEALPLPAAHLAITGLALASAAIGTGAALAHDGAFTRPNLFFLTLGSDSAATTFASRLAAAPLFDALAHHYRTTEGLTLPELRAEMLGLHQQRRHLFAEFAPGVARHHRDLLTIEQRLSMLRRDLHRDYLDVVTHVPPGQLLGRLLAQPQGFSLLNPAARHSASVFCATPGSAASRDEAALLAGYAGEAVSSDRKFHDTHFAAEPCLTVLWSLRPADWRVLAAHPRFSSSPLLPRFLILDSTALDPAPAPEQQPPSADFVSLATEPFAMTWHQTLKTLIHWKFAPTPIVSQLSDEAAALLQSFASECHHPAGTLDDDRRHLLPTQAYRLSLLLHLADSAAAEPSASTVPHDPSAEDSPESFPDLPPDFIPASTAARAIALLRWLLAQQQPLLDSLDQLPDPHLQKVLRVLPRAGGRLSIRDLRRLHSFTPARVQSLVDSYPDLLRLDEDPKSTPGRKKSPTLILLSSTESSSAETGSESNSPIEN